MNTNTEQPNPSPVELSEVKKPMTPRGRPKVDIVWPEGNFTFDSLKQANVLSASSLRKKMRAELVKGGILKLNTLKTAFGRPRNVFQKSNESN